MESLLGLEEELAAKLVVHEALSTRLIIFAAAQLQSVYAAAPALPREIGKKTLRNLAQMVDAAASRARRQLRKSCCTRPRSSEN
jgi:hypothetical protein